MDQLQEFGKNYMYVIPASVLLTMLFLHWQKYTLKNQHVKLLDSTFILRNSLFVGLIAFIIVYLNKPLPRFEDSLYVNPADF